MTLAKSGAEGDLDDHVLRAITDDDTFRVMAATTTHTVRKAIASQAVDGATADHFADLLTGMVLVRETMSPGHRVQGVLKGAGGTGSLVADTHPDGSTRGLVQLGKREPQFSIGRGSVLTVMRSMARGRIHRSVTAPEDGTTVSQALMTYMQESEQIVSTIAIGTCWRDGEVVQAGGYVVQLLPGASRGPLMVMTERLEHLPPIGELLADLDGSPRRLLDELLYLFPHAQLDRRPVRYACKCSREAVVASLASLGRDELANMVRESEVIEVSCDYCHTDYAVSRAHLRGLLEPS
jgi:molecular chaperone Hsp33